MYGMILWRVGVDVDLSGVGVTVGMGAIQGNAIQGLKDSGDESPQYYKLINADEEGNTDGHW